MAIQVRIPTPLRKFTEGQETVTAEGSTVHAVLNDLGEKHPGIREKIFDAEGKPRRFVNVFYKDEDIRFLQGTDTPVDDGSEISIVPAIAGG